MRTDSTGMKVAAAVTLTAAFFSPQTREVLRRGVVHGLAGVLTAGDAIASFARGVGRGIRDPVAPPTEPPLAEPPDGSLAPPVAAAAKAGARGAPSAAASAAATGASTAKGAKAPAASRVRKRRSPGSQNAPVTASDSASAPGSRAAQPVESTRG